MPAASRRARLFTAQPAMRPTSIAKISTKSPEISLLNPCNNKGHYTDRAHDARLPEPFHQCLPEIPLKENKAFLTSRRLCKCRKAGPSPPDGGPYHTKCPADTPEKSKPKDCVNNSDEIRRTRGLISHFSGTRPFCGVSERVVSTRKKRIPNLGGICRNSRFPFSRRVPTV